MELSDSTLGVVVLVVLAVVILAMFTESGGLAVLIGLAILAVVGYVLYVVAARVHDKLRHGKPMYRAGGGE